MHAICLTQDIDVLEQQLKKYKQELAALHSSTQDRLKKNRPRTLLLTPPAPRSGELDSEL